MSRHATSPSISFLAISSSWPIWSISKYVNSPPGCVCVCGGVFRVGLCVALCAGYVHVYVTGVGCPATCPSVPTSTHHLMGGGGSGGGLYGWVSCKEQWSDSKDALCMCVPWVRPLVAHLHWQWSGGDLCNALVSRSTVPQHPGHRSPPKKQCQIKGAHLRVRWRPVCCWLLRAGWTCALVLSTH
jgi:hypothetical protein